MKAKKIVAIVAVALIIAVFGTANGIAFSMSNIITEWLCGYSTGASDNSMLRQEGEALAKQIQGEGTVLLQNDGDLLPLDVTTTPKVNVFGWASTEWVYGGSGSGQVINTKTDLYKAFDDYGITYNSELKSAYESFRSNRQYSDALHSFNYEFSRLYEPTMSYFSDSLLNQAKQFSDTAIVVLGRVSGESNDAPKTQYKINARNGSVVTDNTRTYLEISTEEEALLGYVGTNYENVIVIINSVCTMELGFMETIPGLDSCLLVGGTGTTGASVIPEIIYGDVTPSGKTVDTFPYALESAPSYADTGSGNDSTNFYTNGSDLYPVKDEKGNAVQHTNGSHNEPYKGVAYTDYRDGIYVGYKWYETADEMHYWDVEGGYGNVVQYPFGFGLSYTSFTWEVVSVIPANGSSLTKNGTIEINVRVKNVGSFPGQDVVQVYYNPPYTAGGIEKASVNLVAFDKTTKVLQPGEEQLLSLKFNVEDMKSYDCYDANGNGFEGYELEKGNYVITLRTDSHTVKNTERATITYKVDSNITYPVDTVTGATVENLFTGANVTDGVAIDGNSDGSAQITYLSRADFEGTFPAQKAANRAMTTAVRNLNLFNQTQFNAMLDENDQPVQAGQASTLGLVFENKQITQLGILLGYDFTAPEWEEVLDSITLAEMQNLVLHGYVHTRAIASVGKPETRDLDGPNQIGSFSGETGTTGFNSVVAAQTWNVQLVYNMGLTIAKEAAAKGISGWYGPGVNIHRSPFAGRNFEYYSEDAYLSGVMAANAVKAAKNAGVYSFVKHLALYETESGRDGMYTWLTEQALREVYVRPFEIAIKQGGATAIMTSYGRIGAVWTGGSKALLTELVRTEWGFNGSFLTDYADHQNFMNGDQMLLAGGDLWMDGFKNDGSFKYSTTSNTFRQNLRRAAKDTLYMWLNALATNATYNEDEDNVPIITSVPELNFAWWIPVLIGVDVIVAGGCALWIISAFKKKKQIPQA